MAGEVDHTRRDRGRVMTDSPDLAAAKRLLEAAKRHGFAFQRIAPGEDGPLWGVRTSADWVDEIYLGGFSTGCTAARRRRFPWSCPAGCQSPNA